MIVLVGESGAGKSTIEKILVDKYGFNNIISYTTREPRTGEVDGVDYHFVTKSEFRRLKLQAPFVETAAYNGWYYGTAKRDYIKDNAVAVLTPSGLRQVQKISDINIVSFYISVPRRDRLIKILQRGDNIDEAYGRNLSDVEMFDGIETEVDFTMYNYGYRIPAYTLAERISKFKI